MMKRKHEMHIDENLSTQCARLYEDWLHTQNIYSVQEVKNMNKLGTKKNQEINSGTRDAEMLQEGTFHGGESLAGGTFHGGENLAGGTFH
jgi:hypothetical protein